MIPEATATKTRYPKIVSFSIKDIIGYDYFMQLTMEMMKPMKKLLKTYPQRMQTEWIRHRQQISHRHHKRREQVTGTDTNGVDKAQT